MNSFIAISALIIFSFNVSRASDTVALFRVVCNASSPGIPEDQIVIIDQAYRPGEVPYSKNSEEAPKYEKGSRSFLNRVFPNEKKLTVNFRLFNDGQASELLTKIEKNDNPIEINKVAEAVIARGKIAAFPEGTANSNHDFETELKRFQNSFLFTKSFPSISPPDNQVGFEMSDNSFYSPSNKTFTGSLNIRFEKPFGFRKLTCATPYPITLPIGSDTTEEEDTDIIDAEADDDV